MKLSFFDSIMQDFNMKTAANYSLSDYPKLYLTDTELTLLHRGNPNSRYGKVKRWLQKGDLIHIRRGLYCLGEKLAGNKKNHPFEMAQRIYSPSYISLESALAYHRLIPETVYTTTSATAKRKKTFETPFGLFNYEHLPAANLYIEVELITENDNQFLMAKPWKAIADYVYCHKKNWQSLAPLIESLRINREDLPLIRYEEIEALDEYYHQKRLSLFLKGIKRELGL